MRIFVRLFKFLNRDITGKTWTEESEHHFFGPMILFGSKKPEGSYWEAELDCEGRRISVAIEAPQETQPTEAQVSFARMITSNIDDAFNRVAPILVPEFEKWHQVRFPENWREAVSLVSFSIPANAEETRDWDLCFESLIDKSGHQFTCYFEDGKPSYVSIDG